MNDKKCRNCGAFLPNAPFYILKRQIGQLKVYICPNCGAKNEEWILK